MAVYMGTCPDSKELKLGEREAIWAARMCVGEGGRDCDPSKASAMLWALANRYLLHRGTKHWPSFLYMMRRFSQPINPRWQTGGDLAIKFAGKPAASPRRLARRRRISRMAWEDAPEQIQKVVIQFETGELAPPDGLGGQRISNWASYGSVRRRYPWGIDIDGDWFFEDKRLTDGVVVVNHWDQETCQ